MDGKENEGTPGRLARERKISWMNGRIIQCGNGRIGLFNSPAIEREVTTPGIWNMDDAFDEMNTTFREAVVYPHPFRKPKS